MLDKKQASEPATYVTVVPTSVREANRMVRALATRIRAIHKTNSKLGKRMSMLKEEAGKKISEHRVQVLALAAGIFEFGNSMRNVLLKDGTKTFQLAHGDALSWFTPPESLVYDCSEEEAIALLKKRKLDDCINYSPTVDKVRLKKLLSEKPELFIISLDGLKERVQGPIDKSSDLEIITPREKKAARMAA
jgi:phage host-nuclease inhibitor protein Gam